jgi:deoxyribodipyrimidine photo-lyase
MHIFLFHRDLRLVDNTALIYQIQEVGEVIPIFIFPPEQIDSAKNEYFSNNSVQFMIESLHELSKDIKDKNGKLYFFKGDNMKVLKELHKLINIESISYNLDYTLYARLRDGEIKKWCEENDIECYEKEDYVMYDILDGQTKKADKTPYLVFTPFKNFCYKNLTVPEVNTFNKFKFQKSSKLDSCKYLINENKIDDFYNDNPDINVHGGRKNGLKILSNISKFKDYDHGRDMFMYNTTFLSAYNHFSCVSIREVYHKIVEKLGKKSGLINELHWRDFYYNLYYYVPHMLGKQIGKKNLAFKPKFDKIKWSYNKNLFEKWCNGTLGIPVCDAGMRQLNQTGFQHNRLRMVCSCVLTKLLNIDWRYGEKYYATKLVDYDPIQNSAGWNWQAGGIDPQQVFRIFSPKTQGEKFDPNCEYIKKWIPELNDVPIKDILNWEEKYEEYLKEGIEYYKPAIDYKESRNKISKELLKLNKTN